MSGGRQSTTVRLPVRREPHLVLSFVAATTLGLLLAGGGVLVVVKRTLTQQAEQHAVDQARTITRTLLDRQLRPADLTSTLSPARRKHLSTLFSRASVGPDLRHVTLYGPRGVVFSTRSASDRGSAAPLVARALHGEIVSDVAPNDNGRVLRAFLPLVLRNGGVQAVVEIDQDFAPIAAAARRSSLLIAAILEGLLVLLCVLVVPVLARAAARLRRHLTELDWMASHDHLTGLLNRPGLQRAVEQAGDHERPGGALLLFDLERFHEINDTVGSNNGDQLLKQVAARLDDQFPGHPVARLGEDEFGLLLPTTSPERLDDAVRRVHQLLADPFAIGQIRVNLDARAGAAPIPQGCDFDTLLRHAGLALTTEQRDNRDVPVANGNHPRLADTTIASELRAAIIAGELLLHYQPQTDLHTRAISGVEALIRWQHPELGLLAPAEFIPAVERNGLISEIGRYVLSAGTRQWQHWHHQGITVDLAVNLSAIDLLDVSLPGEITALLVEHRMPAEHLVLEITERTLVQDEQRTRRVLKQLTRIGVRLAIDDYGTGYSSLATLRQLPIQQIKIDRCFVTGIPADRVNDEIVRSTIQLAHALGATVVAEGVETAAELQRLRNHGCDTAQGFLLGRPLASDELTPQLKQSAAALRPTVSVGVLSPTQEVLT